MIAERTSVGSMLAAACLALSTGAASAGDDWTDYEAKVKSAKACIWRQARIHAAGKQDTERAARLAFDRCEDLYRQAKAAHAKAAGLLPKEADMVMAAVRRAVTRDLIEVIANLRQGRPAAVPPAK